MALDWRIDPVAVAVAAVAALVIGAVWYLPPLFGGIWASRNSRYTGRPPDDFLRPRRGRMALQVLLWLVGLLVNAAALAVLARTFGATTPEDAITLALFAWLGIALPLSSWPAVFARQPLAVWLINSIAFLLMEVAMALIVTLWR